MKNDDTHSSLIKVGFIIVLISTLAHGALGLWGYRALRLPLEKGLSESERSTNQKEISMEPGGAVSSDANVKQTYRRVKWTILMGLVMINAMVVLSFLGFFRNTLKRADANFETHIREISAELATAEAAAHEAKKAKRDFLARMSHEIRTPLNAVAGLTGILLKSDLTAEQRDYLNSVQMAYRNLLTVVDGILDYSMVETGQGVLSNSFFNLDQLLEKLCDVFKKRVAQKELALGITIAPKVPRQYMGDVGRLNQVLFHLVDNAVKFTESGEVVVRVEQSDIVDNPIGQTILIFRISDTGIGINAQLVPHLFEPFTQADSSLTRGNKGAGMGLAACKRLVDLMGGEISVQSTPGRGTTIVLTVPLGMPEEVISGSSKEKYLHGLKVLVVEDSKLNRVVVSTLLEGRGLKVTGVENGKMAVKKVTSAAVGYFDAVLMDIQMPVMNGYEATRKIRDWERNVQSSTSKINAAQIQHIDQKPEAGKRTPNTMTRQSATRLPIIALTAHSLEGEKEKCIAAGMDDYITKPIDETQLFETLSRQTDLGKTNKAAHVAAPKQGQGIPSFFNADMALKKIGGRRPLLIKVLSNFEGEFGEAHRRIHSCLLSGDISAARRISHTIKGFAAQICAGDLSRAAGELEKHIREPLDHVEPKLMQFNDALNHTLKDISLYLEKKINSSQAGSEAIDNLHLTDTTGERYLKQLGEYLKSGDMRAIDTWQHSKSYFADAGADHLLMDCDQLINRLDFDGASIILTSLMTYLDKRGDADEQST